MKRRGLIAFAAAGVLIGGAWLATATAVRAQQQPVPAAPPTQAVPPVGPADPNLQIVPVPEGKKVHLLPATLETTQWGWFDNAQPPVLRINSGDTVVMETMMHSHNQIVPGTTIDQIKKLRTDNPGRGPHTMTGPIYVEGAEPGDVLKVAINKIVPRAYAANFNVPGMFGQFPKEYADGQVKYLYLDWDKKITEFLPGIEIPLKPFPGTLAVARKEPGRYSTVPPGEFAGNMDIRDFTEGTTLHVPVHVRGALLWSGDSMPRRVTVKSTSRRLRPLTRSSTSPSM
jgi:Acetamidase/Formamidase family